MIMVWRTLIYIALLGLAWGVYLILRKWMPSRGRLIPLLAGLVAAVVLISGIQWYYSDVGRVIRNTPFLVKYKKKIFKRVYRQSACWACNPDGSDDREFLSQDYVTSRDMQWSADGNRIACSRTKSAREGMHIFTYAADGTDEIQLTTGPGINRRPSWSPDGTKIVFDYRPSMSRLAPHEIYLINTDGTGPIKLIDEKEMDAYHAVWAPDGSRIYFLKKEKMRDDIWSMNPDGSGLRQHTFTPDQNETEPAVSPDGTLIAFTLNRSVIYLMRMDGSGQRPLFEPGTVPEFRKRDPSWSPDGNFLYFTSHSGDLKRRSVYRAPVDGSSMVRIPIPEGQLLNPVVSPDGSTLAYLRFIKSVFRTEDFPTQLSDDDEL